MRFRARVNAEEILDVVDEHNVVVGTATRAEVHQRGHRHRAVHILVFDATGRVYVQRRSLDKDCSPGLWDTSAAGHVDQGETCDAAASRELGEELGLVPSAPIEPLFGIPASRDTGNEFVRVYCCLAERDVVPNPAEIIEGRWVTRTELNQWLARDAAVFTTSFRLIWQQFDSERADREFPRE